MPRRLYGSNITQKQFFDDTMAHIRAVIERTYDGDLVDRNFARKTLLAAQMQLANPEDVTECAVIVDAHHRNPETGELDVDFGPEDPIFA